MLFAAASVLIAAAFASAPRGASDVRETGAASAPLTFIRNAGQTNDAVAFMTRGPGHAFYFTPDKVVLDLQRGERGVALQLHFRGANPDPQIVAERRASGRVNYISGSERHTNLATYEQLRYRNLWPGIDMVLRGQGGTLKYEFLVRPERTRATCVSPTQAPTRSQSPATARSRSARRWAPSATRHRVASREAPPSTAGTPCPGPHTDSRSAPTIARARCSSTPA